MTVFSPPRPCIWPAPDCATDQTNTRCSNSSLRASAYVVFSDANPPKKNNPEKPQAVIFLNPALPTHETTADSRHGYPVRIIQYINLSPSPCYAGYRDDEAAVSVTSSSAPIAEVGQLAGSCLRSSIHNLMLFFSLSSPRCHIISASVFFVFFSVFQLQVVNVNGSFGQSCHVSNHEWGCGAALLL